MMQKKSKGRKTRTDVYVIACMCYGKIMRIGEISKHFVTTNEKI